MSVKASCQREEGWSYGVKLIKYMKMTSFQGLSGNIQFDRNTGYRKNFTLYIVDKTKFGVDLVAYIYITQIILLVSYKKI